MPPKTDLYDHDLYTWTRAQAAALRAGKAEAFDWSHLVRRYQSARQEASMETRLPLATFPESCPWSPAQILDEDFWPEA